MLLASILFTAYKHIGLYFILKDEYINTVLYTVD